MKMEVFLFRYAGDIGFRNRALGAAQARHPDLVNDLVFLSAVNQFKDADGGKKKAMQIQIFFCIPKRGAGAENPYAISPARVEPLPSCLETMNRHTILDIKQSLTDLKRQRRDIDDLKSQGGFSKFKGGIMDLKLKAGTKTRTIDSGLFDDIVAEVIAPGGRLSHFVDGYDETDGGVLNTADPHVAGFKVLNSGSLGAKFDLAQLGIY
jgi:hypothetical protein